MTNLDQEILVVGSRQNFQNVHVVPWEALTENLNILNYHSIVVVLASLGDGPCPSFPVLVDVPKWTRVVFSSSSTGEVIIVGDPNTLVAVDANVKMTAQGLPVSIGTQVERTNLIDDVAEEYESYFKLVSESTFYLRSPCPEFWPEQPNALNTLKQLYPTVKSIDVQNVEALARARAEDGPMIAMRFRLRAPGALSSVDRTDIRSCPITVLPSTTDPEEGVSLLLRQRFGISNVTPPPLWIDKWGLPKERPIADELEANRKKIDKLKEEAVRIQERLDKESRPKEILFETGGRLETLVAEVLRTLGAEVEELGQPDREDGRMRTPLDSRILYEVKGTQSRAKREYARQVLDWHTGAQLEDNGWNGTPLLIVNANRLDDPSEHEQPFHGKIETFAGDRGLALCTTVDLFEAVVADQEGKLDRDLFWQALTRGGRVNIEECITSTNGKGISDG